METIFYDKTGKGREEISSRKYQLSPRLRPLLVMIDGKHGSHELLQRLAGIGLNQDALNELLHSGFIAPVQTISIDANKTPQPKAVHVDLPKALATNIEDAGLNATASLEPGATTSITSEKTHAEKLTSLRQFFTETIKGNLGLRGFTLQLKVERADSLDDFIALSEDYVEALYKSKGQQIARNLEARLMQLIDDAR